VRIARALLAGLVLALAVAATATAERARFDTQVFALIPSPGFPARAYVAPNKRVYEGTYTNPSGDSVPSLVREYDKRGTLLRTWAIDGQELSEDHGVQVATSDARGRLVLLDKAPARVLVLNPRNHRQRTYATFPGEALPNYAAWGPRGELYVTDYTHGVLWRVPRGGGEAKVWLDDARLDGAEFGTTGIVLARDRSHLLISQQSSAGGGDGNPTTGRLYEIAIGPDRNPGAIRTIWESQPFDGPDGFWLDRQGHIYISLLVANQIAVIGPDGAELERFPDASANGANGSAVPFDNPSSVMFLGKRLMIANQAFISGDTSHMAILDVFVGERGQREFIPKRAGRRR
jgi:sugar lactone lactonase YvrE